jgi:hypothetical protein
MPINVELLFSLNRARAKIAGTKPSCQFRSFAKRSGRPLTITRGRLPNEAKSSSIYEAFAFGNGKTNPIGGESLRVGPSASLGMTFWEEADEQDQTKPNDRGNVRCFFRDEVTTAAFSTKQSQLIATPI